MTGSGHLLGAVEENLQVGADERCRDQAEPLQRRVAPSNVGGVQEREAEAAPLGERGEGGCPDR